FAPSTHAPQNASDVLCPGGAAFAPERTELSDAFCPVEELPPPESRPPRKPVHKSNAPEFPLLSTKPPQNRPNSTCSPATVESTRGSPAPIFKKGNHMSSPSQVTANRLNAQHSTGPVTPEGKAASSRNALKSGLHSE